MNLSKKQKLTRYQIEPDSKMVADYIDNYARRNGEFIVAEESAEKDVLKGDVISEDGSVINEEASISVEMIKDEKIRNEFLGNSWL